MTKTELRARLLRTIDGVPAGSIGEVLNATQPNGLLVKFANREKPMLVKNEHAELFRKP